MNQENSVSEASLDYATLGREQESDFEEEREDQPSEINEPFNPKKIKTRTRSIVVAQLVARIKHKEIDLAPDFQRNEVWDYERKSRLIESLLLRIPIPVFYVSADDNENWSVVDGVQRAWAINEYVTDKYPLKGLEYLDKYNGKFHRDLQRPMQRRIGETEIVINVIEVGTPERVKFNIFRRINTGGILLNPQEIRHAIYPGPARDYLKDLAGTEEFRKATGGKISDKRMQARECILRFLAFHLESWDKYPTDPQKNSPAKDFNDYLCGAMEKINTMSEEDRERLKEDFKRAMGAAFDIFGKDAFRKPSTEERRNPINKGLFEGWGVGLARLSIEELQKLVKKHEYIKKEFESLLKRDADFKEAISSSTGHKRSVRKRFGAIQNLIEKSL